ncbi:MAG: hypothetical protein KBT40_04570 [bacterium]|nr:hypothetical protein [Candidatus Minthenecus merdequi]
MRKFLIPILLLIVLKANAQNTLKNDSVFQAQVAAERLQDSTDIDRIKSLYIDALRYKEISKTNGDRELLLKTYACLEQSIHIQDSLNIPAPSYYAAASFQIALFHLSTQNYKAAYFYINQAHNNEPDNTEYLEYLVYMIENNDNPASQKIAINYLQKLRKLNPFNSSYCLHLVNSYSDLGKYKKAFHELEAYRKLEGESLTSLQYEVALLYETGKEEAIPDVFSNYISRNPQDRQSAEMMLTNHYRRAGQYDKSFEVLNRNLDYITNYDLPKLLNPYIGFHLDNKDTVSVRHLLDTIQSLHPSDVSVYEYILTINEVLRDTVAIMNTLNHICQLDRRNEDAYRTLFGIYAAREMNDSTLVIASRAHKLFQNDEWAYRHILCLSNDTSLSDSLLKVCHQAIIDAEESGIKGIAYIFIGDYMMQHDSLQAAFSAYDSCLVYLPDNSYVMNNYAYSLATSPDVTESDLARAEKMAAAAMKKDPSSSPVIDTYAWILFLRNDALSARMYYERLIRMATDGKIVLDPTTCYHIYSVFAKLGYNDEAEKYLTKARELYYLAPNSVREQKIIDALK